MDAPARRPRLVGHVNGRRQRRPAGLSAARCVVVDPRSTTLPCESGAMQLLLCIEVQPVVHSEWFLREAARALAPGGVMVAVYWNSLSLRGAVAKRVSRLRARSPHPCYRQSYHRWRCALRDHGFRVLSERGLCWFPFGRGSDSRLVPFAVRLEHGLGLARLPALSPWVVVTAQRSAQSM